MKKIKCLLTAVFLGIFFCPCSALSHDQNSDNLKLFDDGRVMIGSESIPTIGWGQHDGDLEEAGGALEVRGGDIAIRGLPAGEGGVRRLTFGGGDSGNMPIGGLEMIYHADADPGPFPSMQVWAPGDLKIQSQYAGLEVISNNIFIGGYRKSGPGQYGNESVGIFIENNNICIGRCK